MKNILFTFSFLLILSCSTQTVSVDYDRHQDFSQIKDFKMEWLESTSNELDVQRIQSAIQSELAGKGMNFNPDSDVRLTISSEEYISKNQNSQVGIGMGGGNHGFGTSIGIGIPITSQKLNRHFLISIYNSENQMIWNGQLEIQMPGNAGPEVIEANIQKGVQKLFRKYPPKSK